MIQDLKFLSLLLLLLMLSPVLGHYMANVFMNKYHFLDPLERVIYRVLGINSKHEMDWKQYLKGLLLMTFLGFFFTLIVQLAQGFLPFNPQKFEGVPFWLAFNTAISFSTNTNWQAYSGETTLSYFTQMVALTSQNFLSAAIGLCTVVAFIRGILGRGPSLGNFYNDLTKSILYILLPLSILFSIFLVFEGVIQNFAPYLEVTTLEGKSQVIPMGPVASQEAIKQLGTNGGGFFNANSAHPFENPTFLTDILENLAILLIPAATVFMYGKMMKSQKQASVIFLTMSFLWLIGLFTADYFQMIAYESLPVLPNLEGQELRIGEFPSLLWTISTTATASGSTNSSISSMAPMAGGVALINLMLGEVIFGGVGVGLAGMLMFIISTVFIAGLMVGRTPEYLGKKIEKYEIKWVMLAVLAPSAFCLVVSGILILIPQAIASFGNPGPHGLTELLYATASATANNGSAMSSLDANNNLYNIVLGLIMMSSRIVIIISSLAIAGLMAPKKLIPFTRGTFRTNTFLFASLLTGIILIFAGLTFFPALTLGPILEQSIYWENQVLS